MMDKAPKINDRVKSKNQKGAIQIAGTLVGLIDAKHYVKNMIPPGASEANFDLVWGKSNPDWRDGLVAIVFFDSAQKTATLEEWVVGGMSKGIGKLQCEEEYEKRCPRVRSVVFPYGDLMVE